MSLFDRKDPEGYMDVYEASKKWDMTPSEVTMLCGAKLVKGAVHSEVDGRWIIPKDAPYPYNTTDAKIITIW